MKFNSQIGKSLIEILGVLLLISVAFGFGFSKYTQDRHHQNMLEIVETMHTFFERYQTNAADIFKQNSTCFFALFSIIVLGGKTRLVNRQRSCRRGSL